MTRARLWLGLALAAAAQAACAETVFVSDEQANVVHAVVPPDWTAIVAIPVGRRPRGLGLSPDGKRLYVAVGGDDRIDVIDVASRKRVGSLASGPDPERFAISPDGHWLYVANEDDNRVSFLDLRSGRIAHEVEVGAEPEGMAISPDGRILVCTSETASLAHFIDTREARVLGSVLVGTRPRDALFTPDGKQVWVSSETRGSLTLIDVPTRTAVATVDLDAYAEGDAPMQAVGMTASHDGGRLFVALGRANRVAEIDTATRKPVRFHDVGFRNWGVALDGAQHRLYASNGLSGDVTVIDVRGHRVETRIVTGGKPWGVVVAP